jgi:hypothetical protein
MSRHTSQHDTGMCSHCYDEMHNSALIHCDCGRKYCIDCYTNDDKAECAQCGHRACKACMVRNDDGEWFCNTASDIQEIGLAKQTPEARKKMRLEISECYQQFMEK